MVKVNSKPIAKGPRYIVSACLVGKNCVYDGSSKYYNPRVKELLDSGMAVALCPEELGGLKVPRPPVEIFAGSGEDVLAGRAYVFNKEGKDVTINIIKGAKEFLNIADEYAIREAILKARSPSCGCGRIYDGTFTNKLKNGNGVTAALLLRNNIRVITDEEFLRGRVSSSSKKNSKKVTRSRTVKNAKNNKYGKRQKSKTR